MKRYVVQARYAGATSTVVSEHDDGHDARNGLKEALRRGLHHATICDTSTQPWTVVEEQTRRPRPGDWITGLDEDGTRYTGRVVSIDFDEYDLADVFAGYRGGGERVDGQRAVKFEQFDVEAVVGIHYQPGDVEAR